MYTNTPQHHMILFSLLKELYVIFSLLDLLEIFAIYTTSGIMTCTVACHDALCLCSSPAFVYWPGQQTGPQISSKQGPKCASKSPLPPCLRNRSSPSAPLFKGDESNYL